MVICALLHIFCSYLSSTIKMIITVWSLPTVLRKLGRSSSAFMVSLVQSWPLLVAMSIRYPVKFTVCLAPRLTSLLHRVKYKSFPRESIPSVASSTGSFRPRNWVKVTAEIFGELSFSAGQLFGRFGRMHLAPFKLRQYGKNGCSHLTAEIERAIAFWLYVLLRGPFRAVPRILAHRLSLR